DGVGDVTGGGERELSTTEDAEDTDDSFSDHDSSPLFYHSRGSATRRNAGPREVLQRQRAAGSTNVSPTSESATRSGSSALLKRRIGSSMGGRPSGNVW